MGPTGLSDEAERRIQALLDPPRLVRPLKLSPDGLSDIEKAQWQMEEDRKWAETVRQHDLEQRKVMIEGGLVFQSNRLEDMAFEESVAKKTGDMGGLTREQRRQVNQQKHHRQNLEREVERIEVKLEEMKASGESLESNKAKYYQGRLDKIYEELAKEI